MHDDTQRYCLKDDVCFFKIFDYYNTSSLSRDIKENEDVSKNDTTRVQCDRDEKIDSSS